MSDLNVTPPPAPAADPPAADNPVKSLREALDARTAELKTEREAKAALEAKIQEADRAKLDEVDRLKLEKTELEPFKARAERFEKSMQARYERELAGIPEQYRPQVEKLSATGDWDARLEAIEAARALLPAQGGPAGTVTAPAQRPGPGGEAPKVNPKDPLGSYFRDVAKPVNLTPTKADTEQIKQNMAGDTGADVKTWQPGQPIR